MRLYDIHYHAFDLSHVNLIAFLSRDDLVTRKGLDDLLKKLPWYLKLAPPCLARIKFIEQIITERVRKFIREDSGRIRSLLSVLENSIESHFLYIDYFLRNKEPVIINPPSLNTGYTLDIDKIILCPLLMDFGDKNMGNQAQFYNLPPSKPIVNQVVDIINAIYFYYHYEFSPGTVSFGRLNATKIIHDPPSRFFEIYPFLGINTVNYTLEQIKRIFEKYFTGFENDNPSSRKEKLFRKMGTVHLDITEISEKKGFKALTEKKDFNYLFAGVKLYPPLGFDPWPDKTEEREKVEFLYSTCLQKKIPIMTHCSDGGFLTDSNGRDYSDPAKHWSNVLTHPEFRNLKIDFAHFGSQRSGDTAWRQTILRYLETNSNVYTDISCRGINLDFYKSFKTNLTPANTSRFLFGSDFLINLLWIDSYNHYLDLFLSDNALEQDIKLKLCNENPERFLFG